MVAPSHHSLAHRSHISSALRHELPYKVNGRKHFCLPIAPFTPIL
jgi:hypothetical protein